jgi:peptidase YpeB-like protein
MRKFAASVFALGLIAGSSLAIAATVSDDQIKQNLESQGYTNVQISKHEGNHIDATAEKNGMQQKLEIDAQTGQISPEGVNENGNEKEKETH